MTVDNDEGKEAEGEAGLAALKCAEQALRESEYKLRQIIETMPGLVWSTGPDGEPTHFNQRILDYSGMPSEQFMHRGWEAFVHPADYPKTAEAFYHAIETGTSYQGVMRLRRANGEFRWHDARSEPLRDQQGRIVQWYGLAVDIDERKKAEDQLRGSEAYLAEAQRLSHTGTTVYNDTTVLYLSDENYRIFGFDPRNGLPSREALLQTVHPDDRGRAQEEARRGVRQKRDYKLEFRLLLPDGTIKYIEGIAHPRFSESGELVEIVGTIIDVTERKRVDDALRESEAKFRSAIDGIAGIVSIHYPNGEVEAVNRQCLEYFGRSLEWLKNWGTTDAVHPEDFPRVVEMFTRAMASGIPYQIDQRLRRFDGEYRWFNNRGVPILDDSGRIARWYVLITDIEDRKRAEDALRSAIDGIAGLVVTMAPNGELETVNRQAFEYFGRSLEELKQWETSDAVHSDDLPQLLEVLRRAIASGNPYHIDLRMRRFDGEYRWFDSRGVPILDDSGRIARWYVLATDIEERTRALAQLEQMQSDFAHMNRVATMGQLTASITHEVNQPITAAVTYALAARRFLSAEPPNFREVDDALSLIVKEGNRAGEVVERVRALVKKAPVRKDAVAIDDAILEVIALTRTEAANKSVSVRTQFAEGLPRVQGDRVQLQQVMLNLVVNAIQAMSGTGEGAHELVISIDAVPSEDSVRVGVRDTGPGLSPESLSRLFDPFYTTKPEGMGMGLSICRSIIETHGGRLWATPCEPQGALFQFTIPAT
jgi:PAS domain S-box-containing protein